MQPIPAQTLSAADLMAAVGITSARLTNILSKTDLLLCSDSEGQGRARSFCKIDAYQIGIMAKLADLTGNVEYAARATNWLLFKAEAELYAFLDDAVSFGYPKRSPAAGLGAVYGPAANEKLAVLDILRERLCDTPEAWPEYYRERKNELFLVVLGPTPAGKDFAYPELMEWHELALEQRARLGAVIFSLTSLLNLIDAQLGSERR